MRELNECTAEVFRRSEKRIKERARNRNRILALCIPVCLIVTVWSVMISPALIPVSETSDHAPADGQMNGNAPGSLACPYTAVEIQPAGLFPEEHYGKVTDKEAVAEMFRAIHLLFADAAGNGLNSIENLPATEDTANQNLTGSAGKWKVCTITFTTEDGSQAVYHLSEDTLVNVSTNERVFLSAAQAAGLMAVLGISE